MKLKQDANIIKMAFFGHLHVETIGAILPFDSVSNILMFNILNDKGLSRHNVALMQALYEKQSAIVLWNGSHTINFLLEKGVRQGRVLCTLLLRAYTDHVLREAELT